MTLSNKQLIAMVRLACEKLDHARACNIQPYDCPHIGDATTCAECWLEKLKEETNDINVKKV